MTLDIDGAEPAVARTPSWPLPAAAGALLALAVVLAFGRAQARAPEAAGFARTLPAASGAVPSAPHGYRPFSQEQLASRAGFAVLAEMLR